jgi:hypothetical protein
LKESNFSKAIVNVIGVEWKSLNAFDKFFLGKQGAELFRGVRIAFVMDEEVYDGFAKIVAQNRGAIVGVFFDLDDALEWLYKV